MKELVSYLRDLEIDGKPLNPMGGICEQVRRKFGIDAEHRIRDLLEEWPEFTGRKWFPIAAPDNYDMTPEEAYFQLEKQKWDTNHDYGMARRRACGWLADQIEKGN